MSDLERRISVEIGRVVTNVSNWPRAVAPHMLGRDLAEPIELITAALLPVIEQVRADAKREALSSFAIELGERNKLARTAPVMHPYQRGRADSYESGQLLAERWAAGL